MDISGGIFFSVLSHLEFGPLKNFKFRETLLGLVRVSDPCFGKNQIQRSVTIAGREIVNILFSKYFKSYKSLLFSFHTLGDICPL